MRILLRELGFLKKYWRRVIFAYLCVSGAAGFAMAMPWIVKNAIDVGLAREDTSFLLMSGALVIAVAVLRGAFAFGQSYLGEYLSQAVAYDLRKRHLRPPPARQLCLPRPPANGPAHVARHCGCGGRPHVHLHGIRALCVHPAPLFGVLCSAAVVKLAAHPGGRRVIACYRIPDHRHQ